ncbi:ribonuclease HII [Spirosoma rhododendri]|uniref:Ribonuclease HII n=1 Tax=Spirosoma rhododendri TaxID=2728024 RepID=A0A7L5DJ98_9BACT|nr:ribonuclease HII [Spirosoma rhododendri]QJD78175.1 ribonuclease HII [Spirosoma rhododendri]
MNSKPTTLRPHYNASLIEAGLDEVGRGCLAGPVVAAAVILPPDYQHPILTDSKQLTPRQRDRIRVDIERDALSWAIAEVSPADIDKINILKASFLAMHRAVDQLIARPDRPQPQHLLVDGNRFVPYPLIPHTCIIKGDSLYLSIAAASVLAKTWRDELMAQLGRAYPAYGWAKNAGYPTPVHRDAIRQFGPTPHHRMTFQLLG